MQKTDIEWCGEFLEDGTFVQGYTSNPFNARLVGDRSNRPGWFCPKPDKTGGCANCYAEAINLRFGNGMKFDKENAGKIEFTWREKEAAELLKLNRLHPGAKVFVGDMYDLWQPAVSDELLTRAFDVYDRCADLTLMFLTKFPPRMSRFFQNRYGENIPRHFWVGMSAATEPWLEKYYRFLQQINASVRFLSLEPMLGQINLRKILLAEGRVADCRCGHGHGFTRCPNTGGIAKSCHLCDCDDFQSVNGVHWAILGFESGPKARAGHPDWARSVRDDCQALNIPFFFKQWGSWFPMGEKPSEGKNWKIGKEKALSHIHLPSDERKNVMVKIGKSNAGRFLDGREHHEFPKV